MQSSRANDALLQERQGRQERAFDLIENKVIADSTKKVYRCKINRIVRLLLKVNPRAVDNNGELILPMAWKDLKSLFGDLVTNTDLLKSRRRRGGQEQEEHEEQEDQEDEDQEDEDQEDQEEQQDDPHNVHERENEDISGYQASKRTLLLGALQGYKIALKAYSRDRNVAIDATGMPSGSTLNDLLSRLIKGYGRAVTQKKSTGVMKSKKAKVSWQ